MTFAQVKIGESFINCHDGLCYVKLTSWYAVKQGDWKTYDFSPNDLTLIGSTDGDESFALCVKNCVPHSCFRSKTTYNWNGCESFYNYCKNSLASKLPEW